MVLSSKKNHEFSSPRYALCQVWLKLTQIKRFWRFRHCIFPFSSLPTLVHFFPFTKRLFVSRLCEMGLLVLGAKMKMWKINRRPEGRTDGRTNKKGGQKSSLEIYAQVSLIRSWVSIFFLTMFHQFWNIFILHERILKDIVVGIPLKL